MSSLKDKVYFIFSELVMICLAFLVIPVILLQNLVPLSQSQSLFVSSIDWLIWAAFLLEFAIKLLVAPQRIVWLTSNWLDSLISFVIVLSPLLERITTFFVGAPLLRLVRIWRLLRLAAVTFKSERLWKRINVRVCIMLFFVFCIGLLMAFVATKLQHAADYNIPWFLLFVSIFAVFYAILIGFVFGPL